MKAYSIRVFGQVQGVFFRASTQEQAEALGVMGWCQNEPDGTVLIHVEGEEDSVDGMLSWCRKGSRFSRVDDIEISESTVEGFEDFQIRR